MFRRANTGHNRDMTQTKNDKTQIILMIARMIDNEEISATDGYKIIAALENI